MSRKATPRKPSDSERVRWVRCEGGPLRWVRIERKWSPLDTIRVDGGQYQLVDGDRYQWVER